MAWRFRRPRPQIVKQVDIGEDFVAQVVRIPLVIPDASTILEGHVVVEGKFDLPQLETAQPNVDEDKQEPPNLTPPSS